jgi:hypothetical protein
MDKLADIPIVGGTGKTPLAVPEKKPLVVPQGVDAEKFFQASKAKALMRVEFSPGGAALVRCPYCIMYWRSINMVDVTKFVDGDGNRECKTECSKGHVLTFKPIPQWREERIKMGLQVKP